MDATIQSLEDIKSKYSQLEREHKELQLLCGKQKERYVESEARRTALIKLLREKVDKIDGIKTTIEILREDNLKLNATIQDQSATIERLKKENILLQKKRNEPSNVVERGIKKTTHLTHPNGLNGSHFSHPSFDTSTPDVKKKKKKSPPLVSQHRYSNLDISVNGIRKEKENTDSNGQTASAKKRRLFSLEDDMIDLTLSVEE